MDLRRRQPRRNTRHHKKRLEPGIAAAGHVMFGTVADAENSLWRPDQPCRVPIDGRIGLADPGYLAAQLLVERRDGARRGREARQA